MSRSSFSLGLLALLLKHTLVTLQLLAIRTILMVVSAAYVLRRQYVVECLGCVFDIERLCYGLLLRSN